MKPTALPQVISRVSSVFVIIRFGLIGLLGLGLVWPHNAYAADVEQSPSQVMPPLPVKEPQLGPLIRRDYQDDVERRTMAFIPRSLDSLTPIDLPDTGERWIRVDLSEQQVIAYQGQRPVRGFIISSGLPDTPTITGQFRIRTKVTSQTMSGGDPAKGTYYNLPNVTWVQYFVHEYAFHGTWWHNDFGRPKSHGCINMTNADAKWLFDWASPGWDGKAKWFHSTQDEPGTLVIVHE